MARRSPQDGRGVHAHGLLLRVLSRGARQLLHRRKLRVAMDVRAGRGARAARRLDQAGRARIGDLAAEAWRSTASSFDAPGVFGALLAEVPPAHDDHVAVVSDINHRALGRLDLCAHRDAARLASYGIGVLSIGTILGCIVLPVVAERLGRRLTMALYFGLMGV